MVWAKQIVSQPATFSQTMKRFTQGILQLRDEQTGCGPLKHINKLQDLTLRLCPNLLPWRGPSLAWPSQSPHSPAPAGENVRVVFVSERTMDPAMPWASSYCLKFWTETIDTLRSRWWIIWSL